MKCNIVIPCAGHAQRFKDAEFTVPKPLIRLRGRYMFERSVGSIEDDHTQLHFVVLEEHVEKFKIDEAIKEVYEDASVHAIPEVLNGCVSTVLTIADKINTDDPLIIQNVDVEYRPTLEWVDHYDPGIDALILTAESDNPKHSYIRINEEKVAIEFAEKKVISSHAVVGTYFFMRGSDFISAATSMQRDTDQRHKGEWYMTPSLSYLQRPVKVADVMHFYPLGTPYDVYHYIESKIED